MQALEAIECVGELDRKRVRAAFERRFTARGMAEGLSPTLPNACASSRPEVTGAAGHRNRFRGS